MLLNIYGVRDALESSSQYLLVGAYYITAVACTRVAERARRLRSITSVLFTSLSTYHFVG